jgi:membrane protein implicated in regulation of membrane protease activity
MTVHMPAIERTISVFKVTTYIGAILYLLVSHTALQAQTVQMPAAEEFSTGEVVESTAAIGEYYVKGSYGDWTLRCLKTEQPQDPVSIVSVDAYARWGRRWQNIT